METLLMTRTAESENSTLKIWYRSSEGIDGTNRPILDAIVLGLEIGVAEAIAARSSWIASSGRDESFASVGLKARGTVSRAKIRLCIFPVMSCHQIHERGTIGSVGTQNMVGNASSYGNFS